MEDEKIYIIQLGPTLGAIFPSYVDLVIKILRIIPHNEHNVEFKLTVE